VVVSVLFNLLPTISVTLNALTEYEQTRGQCTLTKPKSHHATQVPSAKSYADIRKSRLFLLTQAATNFKVQPVKLSTQIFSICAAVFT
jgi:hypothetical protein